MNTPLKILIVEDSENDTLLLVQKLKQGGYAPDFKRVDTAAAMQAALNEQDWDLVIADYRMPQFSGIAALENFKERALDIPFIIVSGTIGEEVAVNTMKAGAHDYLMKDNLARLVPAVERELREAEIRRERKQAGKTLEVHARQQAALFQLSSNLVASLDQVDICQSAVRDLQNTLNYEKVAIFLVDETTGERVLYACTHPSNMLPGLRIKPGQGLTERVLLDGRPHYTPDITQESHYVPGLARSKSELDVPLKIDQTVVGVLSVESTQLDAFGEDDFVVLTAAANQVSVALARSVEHQAVKEAEVRFQTLFDRVPVGLYRTTAAGQFLDANPALVEIFKYPNRESLLKTNILDLYAQPEGRARWQTLMDKDGLVLGFETQMRRYDGVLICIKNSAQAVLSDDEGEGSPLYYEGSLEDITQRKEAEQKIKQLKEFNEGIVQSMAEGIAVEDTDGYFTFVNSAAARLLGYNSAEDLQGRHWRDIIAPDQAHLAEAANERRQHGETDQYEINLICQDGARLPVLVSGSPRFENGNFAGTLAVFTDISERVKMEAQLRRSQKMEAIGQLTAGIAHDFNNLLTAINGFAELLQCQLSSDIPAYEMATKILHSGRNAAGLVSQLLAFSRKQVIKPHVLNLNTVITNVDKIMRHLVGERVELSLALATDLWLVKVDSTQIEQVIINLAVNARAAMPDGGKLIIETANVVLDDDYVAGHLGAQVGEYVVMILTDTGVGMNREIQDRIFEPFFTTKPAHEGTGLGLATVFGIVKQSKGNIWVYSEEGVGTSFKIYLPRVFAADDDTPASIERPQTEMSRGTETVLVVEDEPMVRELAVRTLQELGYTVLQAAHGQQALQLSREYTLPIDLLLTDVVMPELGGKPLAQELKCLYPGLKVLFTSGYTENAVIEQGILPLDIAFIQKPFSPMQLATKIRAVLDNKQN